MLCRCPWRAKREENEEDAEEERGGWNLVVSFLKAAYRFVVLQSLHESPVQERRVQLEHNVDKQAKDERVKQRVESRYAERSWHRRRRGHSRRCIG